MTRGLKSIGLFVLATFAMALAVAPVARAQDEVFGNSYLTPFPAGEVYKTVIIGDDLAEGLTWGLIEAFQGDGRLSIQPKPLNVNGVMRADFEDKLAQLEENLKTDTPQIAIVMLGVWDRVSLRAPGGKRVPVGTPEWQSAYGARADKVMKLLKKRGLSVYWVGLPNVRRSDANEDAQMMNEVLRERVYLNGLKYVDAYAGFIDEQGGYSPYGPDITGKIRLLRHGDGIYFTTPGNRKLAHFVERDLRRDLTQAKQQRSVPLAGAEAEQTKINPDKAAVKDPNAPASSVGVAAAKGLQQEAVRAESGTGSADLKADNGRISLKLLSEGGREEVVALDIVRPAIPQSVVQLVTRKERSDKASQVGDLLIDQIPGGIVVMSSVALGAGGASGASRKLSPTQSPYYRVLVKGERLTPKRGRADDTSWNPVETSRIAPGDADTSIASAPEPDAGADARPSRPR